MFAYTAAKHEAETNHDQAALAALPVPDILQALYELQHFDWRHLPWPGGLEDQPHLLWFELDCAGQALALQAQIEKQQAAVMAAAQLETRLPAQAV